MLPLSVIRSELLAAGVTVEVASGGLMLKGPADVLAQLAAPAPALPPLTGQQKRVLEAIKQLSTDSRGVPPTVRQLGKAIGLSSSSTVHQHIEALRTKGYLLDDESCRGLLIPA